MQLSQTLLCFVRFLLIDEQHTTCQQKSLARDVFFDLKTFLLLVQNKKTKVLIITTLKRARKFIFNKNKYIFND